MNKKKMLMLISNLDCLEVSAIIPTLAWVAETRDMIFEAYLESERDGILFAKTGSTVIGGNHFQQFNYLSAYYDINYVIYKEGNLFDSSIQTFGNKVIVRTNSMKELYHAVGKFLNIKEKKVVLFDKAFLSQGTTSRELFPYFYPEILFEKAWGYIGEKNDFKEEDICKFINELSDDSCVESISTEIAHRYGGEAKGVAFGDPDAILSMMATLCRDKFVALYGPAHCKENKDVIVSEYTENYTDVMNDIEELAKQTGNKVIVGRQTGDGDIFEFGRRGICIKIMDPNRPSFPSVETIPYKWGNQERCWDEDEPSDEQLEEYAKQGKILSALVWHSGEMAHNEAMVNLMDFASFTGMKMGIGVHASRYQTCPQLWEMCSIGRSQGGVKGLIEPILHCGGMGVMTEFNCPPELLVEHCRTAIEKINNIAGKAGMPKGYMAFLDTDLKTLTSVNKEIFKAIETTGLEYFISSALPGRNRILYESNSMIVLNQTPRNVCAGSPYVRISVVEDLYESEKIAPGWVIGVMDSPVVGFSPYIWKQGNKFMELADWYMKGQTINVLPNTISRYARILKRMGYIE